MCENGVADQFHDLRDYGISYLLISVYPSGNPMTCSAVSGTGYRWPSTRLHQSCQLFLSGFFTPRRGDSRPPFAAVALGVGHNPNSVPKLSGTSVGSWNAMPFCIIPDRGQVSEYSAQPSTKQRCHVFHDDDSRSYFANEAEEFSPEPATVAFKALSSARKTDVLARESANDAVRIASILSKPIRCKSGNIVIDTNLGPVLFENLAGFLVDLAERDRLETAGTLQAQ